MSENRNALEYFPVVLACILASISLSAPSVAIAQADLTQLNEDQLIENKHRAAYREEFLRRLEGRPAEERKEALQRLLEPMTTRPFPSHFTDEELLECSSDMSDINAAIKALGELKRRYEDATPAEVTVMATRLRTAFQATPYPVYGEVGFVQNTETYQALGNIAKACLPEADALALFREVYLDSGKRGSVTKFVMSLQGEPFQGLPTQVALAELQERFSQLQPDELVAMGESEELAAIILMATRRFSDNRFAAVKARNWRASMDDIYAMGNFAEPEARALLLAYYESIPRDEDYAERRLRVLSALMTRWDRDRDAEFKALLRRDLAELLAMHHNRNTFRMAGVVEVAARSGDRYFLALLKRYRAELNEAEIREHTALPDDYLQTNIETLRQSLDKAIGALEDAGLSPDIP